MINLNIWAFYADETSHTGSQKKLSAAINAKIAQQRKDDFDAQLAASSADHGDSPVSASRAVASAALTLSASHPVARLSLTTLPEESELKMPNAAFIVAAQQRLALSFPRPMRCNCDLTKLVHDAQHAHVCPFIRKNAGYLRHQMVLSGLREACNECAAPNTIRDHSLKRAQNEREIQPDLFVHKGNASFMIDVSVVHPAADSYARGASRVATYAARLRENDKTRKYKALADRNGFTFVPFVMETTGAMGAEALRFLSMLSEDADHPASFLRNAKRRLAIALQRGNFRVVREGFQNLRDSDL